MILEYLFRDEERILSSAALARVATAWEVDINEQARRRVRQLVQEHAIHARWNNARKSRASAPDRSAQQARQREIAKHARALGSLLAKTALVDGPLDISLLAKALHLNLDTQLQFAPAVVSALAGKARAHYGFDSLWHGLHPC